MRTDTLVGDTLTSSDVSGSDGGIDVADVGEVDVPSADTGSTDTGTTDAGTTDAGTADSGTPDAGGSGSTFVTMMGGGLQDQFRDVAVDSAGNIYVAGGTDSDNYPTTAGAYDRTANGNYDIIVASFDRNGTLRWSTRIGGPNYDRAYALEVDATGVYVAGRAGAGFPTTPGAFQTTFGGDLDVNSLYGPQDAFALKLSLDGSRVLWATYVGTNGREIARDVAIDSAGRVYLALGAVSRPFSFVPSTAYQSAHGGNFDAAVAVLSPTGDAVLAATYLGGPGSDGGTPSIRVDATGIYLLSGASSPGLATAGAYDTTQNGALDFLLAKFSLDCRTAAYVTYLGGSGDDESETHGLALDAAGNAYVNGGTNSMNFPTTAGALRRTFAGINEAIVAKISPDGRSLVASTFLGGSGNDFAQGIDVGPSGDVYVCATTSSPDAPTTATALRRTLGGGTDGWVVVLANDLGSVRYGSFFGGSMDDQGRAVAFDGPAVIAAGMTFSPDHVTTPGSYQTTYGGGTIDATLARLVP